jgi:hypothetical protein
MKLTLIKILSLLLRTGTAAISAPVARARTTIVDDSGINHHLVKRAGMETECITTDRYLPRQRRHCFSTIIVRLPQYEAHGDDEMKKASYLYTFGIVIRPAGTNPAD